MAATEVILVRHGESVGNVAREKADAAGDERIAIDQRDADVLLSELGRVQAGQVGKWLASRPVQQRPTALWSSTYARAQQTAELAMAAADWPLPVRLDERLRDRELGILDMLTWVGVRARFPKEADRKQLLGKLYYRPPGGESWADVALRQRSFLTELDRPECPDRVLIVAHDAVILLWRYVCEQLTEVQLLELAHRDRIENASITRLSRSAGGTRWQLDAFNDCSHLL